MNMQTKIIQIGNSKGIRLGKTILDKYNFGDMVNIRLEENFLIIEPVSKPRSGWEASFKEMRRNGDDELLMDDIFDDETDWP